MDGLQRPKLLGEGHLFFVGQPGCPEQQDGVLRESVVNPINRRRGQRLADVDVLNLSKKCLTQSAYTQTHDAILPAKLIPIKIIEKFTHFMAHLKSHCCVARAFTT